MAVRLATRMRTGGAAVAVGRALHVAAATRSVPLVAPAAATGMPWKRVRRGVDEPEFLTTTAAFRGRELWFSLAPGRLVAGIGGLRCRVGLPSEGGGHRGKPSTACSASDGADLGRAPCWCVTIATERNLRHLLTPPPHCAGGGWLD